MLVLISIILIAFKVEQPTNPHCPTLNGGQYTRSDPSKDKYSGPFISCTSGAGTLLKFNGTKFLNLQTDDVSDSNLIEAINVNSIIMNCPFTNCNYSSSLISFNGADKEFTLTGNTIINCPSRQLSKNTIYSLAQRSVIEGNNITYQSTEATKSCRAYYIDSTLSTIFINNYITNSNINKDEGSGLTSPSLGSNTPEGISGCIFSGCSGQNGAILFLRELNKDFSITNVTFERTRNAYGAESGYLISIMDKRPNSKLTFS